MSIKTIAGVLKIERAHGTVVIVHTESGRRVETLTWDEKSQSLMDGRRPFANPSTLRVRRGEGLVPFSIESLRRGDKLVEALPSEELISHVPSDRNLAIELGYVRRGR